MPAGTIQRTQRTKCQGMRAAARLRRPAAALAFCLLPSALCRFPLPRSPDRRRYLPPDPPARSPVVIAPRATGLRTTDCSRPRASDDRSRPIDPAGGRSARGARRGLVDPAVPRPPGASGDRRASPLRRRVGRGGGRRPGRRLPRAGPALAGPVGGPGPQVRRAARTGPTSATSSSRGSATSAWRSPSTGGCLTSRRSTSSSPPTAASD